MISLSLTRTVHTTALDNALFLASQKDGKVFEELVHLIATYFTVRKLQIENNKIPK